MNILLINSNRYKDSPVPPIGPEYIYGALKNKNFNVHFIDLCFSKDPVKELKSKLKKNKPGNCRDHNTTD